MHLMLGCETLVYGFLALGRDSDHRGGQFGRYLHGCCHYEFRRPNHDSHSATYFSRSAVVETDNGVFAVVAKSLSVKFLEGIARNPQDVGSIEDMNAAIVAEAVGSRG